MTKEFSLLAFLKTGTDRLGGWYLKFTCVKALSRALDGWTRSFKFLHLYTRVCFLKRGVQKITPCVLPSFSLSLSVSVACTHTHTLAFFLSLHLS